MVYGINDGQAPYYDYMLAFEAKIPPLGFASFTLSPAVDGACNGGDLTDRNTKAFVKHEKRHPADQMTPADDVVAAALQRRADMEDTAGFLPDGDLMGWQRLIRQTRVQLADSPPATVVMENRFLKVRIRRNPE